MRGRGVVAAAILITALIGCDTLPTIPNTQQLVIQAYLYAGERVSDIHITGSLPLGDTTALATPINDASVVLIKHGVRYALTRAPGDSGYYEYKAANLV